MMARRNESGIALVIVLWVVILLTVIVSSFVYSSRSHIQATANLLTRARAEALADAGVHRAIHELFKPSEDGARWKPDGLEHVLDMGGAHVKVRIYDEAAFLDLNAAPEELLRGLFLSVGVDAEQADTLVSAIQDWRDPDDLVRAGGAEVEEYRAAGLKYMPANSAFKRLDELKLVLGMTPELFDRVVGALTVHAMSSRINIESAPRQVLLAVPKTNVEDVDAYVALRQEELQAGQVPTAFLPAAPYAGGRANMVYTIRSEVASDDGVAFVREAVARLARGNPKHPFGFLDWREARL
jgi:general secretion pathway protein K